MFSFLKKKMDTKQSEENESNAFLDAQNAVFNTVEPPKPSEDTTDYQAYTYQPPKIDVPVYKARNTNQLGIVVDKDQLGFNIEDINSNLKTLELTSDEGEMLDLDTKEIEITSEQRENVLEPLPEIESKIEVVESNDSNEFNLSTISEDVSVNKEEEEEKEFAIFGSSEGPSEAKNFQVDDHVEEKIVLDTDVKFTPDGHKICPNCGTILKPDAPVCFMCSKNFILKK